MAQGEERHQSYSSQSDSESGKGGKQSESGEGNRDKDEDEVQVVNEIRSQTRNKFECPLHCGAKVFQLP